MYYKGAQAGDFCNSLKRRLIWCESITIGLLEPASQDDISSICDFEIGTRELRFIDEEPDDVDEEIHELTSVHQLNISSCMLRAVSAS